MDVRVLKFLNRQSKNLEKILKNYQKIKIVFDRDVDGLMSCLIVLCVLEKLNKKVEYFSIKVKDLKNFLSKQKNSNCLYIFLDLSIEKEFLAEIKNKKLKCIWIDHHQLKVFSFKDIFLINPALINSSIYLPTSAISYIIFDRIYHIDKLLFFASIGIVADKGEKFSENILKKAERKFNLKIEDFFEISKKVNSLFIFEKDIEKYVPKMRNIAFFKSKELNKIYNKAQKILSKEFKNAIKKHIEIGSFFLYKIRTKFNIRSTIANMLSQEFKDKIIIVYEIRKNEIIMSLRSNDSKINLLEIFSKFNINFKSFGGHKNACGAVMSKEEFKKFLKKLKEYGRNK